MGLRGGLSLILRGNLKRDFIRHLKGITLEEEEPYSVGAFLTRMQTFLSRKSLKLHYEKDTCE